MSMSIFGLLATVELVLPVLASVLNLILLIRSLRGRPPVPGVEAAS